MLVVSRVVRELVNLGAPLTLAGMQVTQVTRPGGWCHRMQSFFSRYKHFAATLRAAHKVVSCRVWHEIRAGGGDTLHMLSISQWRHHLYQAIKLDQKICSAGRILAIGAELCDQ